MSEHDDRLPMQHMLEHAREAVAALKGVPPSAVYTAIKRGELSPQQISGRVWVLRRSAVEMWDPHRQRGPRGPHPRSKPRGRP